MNFMYIQHSMKKVRLLADGGDWIWEIDGKEYALNPAIERLLVYYFYTGAYAPFYELLRSNLPKKVNMAYSPECLKASFEESHPSESIETYNRDLIPEYADPVNGLWVNSDGKTSFWISLDDERKMLFELKNTGYVWNNCLHHLRMAADRYGLQLSDEFLSQSLELFLEQHGIETGSVRLIDSQQKNHQDKTNNNKIREEVREYASKEWKRQHPESKKGETRSSHVVSKNTKNGTDISIALLFVVLGTFFHIIPIVNGITGNFWPFVFLLFNIGMIKGFLWHESFDDVALLFLVYYLLVSVFYVFATVYTWHNFIIAFTYLFCSAQGIFITIYSLVSLVSKNKHNSK